MGHTFLSFLSPTRPAYTYLVGLVLYVQLLEHQPTGRILDVGAGVHKGKATFAQEWAKVHPVNGMSCGGREGGQGV